MTGVSIIIAGSISRIQTEAKIAAPSSRPRSLRHGHLISILVARTSPAMQRHNAAVTVTFGP
jgi:hypothetical protein